MLRNLKPTSNSDEAAAAAEIEKLKIEKLKEELRKANAEKAVLEKQLRDYSEKMEQKVQERTRELEVINRIATTASHSLNLDQILRESLVKVLELLQQDTGGVFLVYEETNQMILKSHSGLPEELVRQLDGIPLGQGCPGVVAVEGELIVEDIREDNKSTRDFKGFPEFKSIAGIPLESKGKVRGVICVINRGKDGFATEELELLKTIGSEIGVAIENAWLYEKSNLHSKKMEELSITDSLTGLYNRRYFYKSLKEEIARASRQQNPVSLLVVDLDNLKRYNDKYGHIKGDEALRGVSQAITACIRQNVDSGYRFGGDEFAVILPYSDEQRAVDIAERIRKTYEDFSFPETSVSIGLTELMFGEHVDELITRADTGMYFAKNAGGNKVHIIKKNNNPEV